MKTHLYIDDSSSIPKVIIDGVEINNLVSMKLDWKTKDGLGSGCYIFSIEYMCSHTNSKITKSFEKL